MSYGNEPKQELVPPSDGQAIRPKVSPPMRDVVGKVAFVTGGDSGIGLGITHALLRAGMKVVITYRSTAHLDAARQTLREAGRRLHAINLDVTDRAAVAAAAKEAISVFGTVHLLVNNAGVAPMLPLSSATFDDWDWCMRVNVDGVYNGIRTFLPYMKAHGEGGQIVATSSLWGGLIVGPFWGIYSTSKFAVVGMMEALRSELVNTNIGVSVFCPAGVNSNLGDSVRNRPAGFADTGTPDTEILSQIQRFSEKRERVMQNAATSRPKMDAIEAGERVLRGIRNNDLYILSHAECEQAIRDRCDALLASIPKGEPAPSPGRVAMAELARNPIYTDERDRKKPSPRGG